MKNTDQTDWELIEAISNDDYLSYNKLFMRYYQHLCRFVFSILNNKSDSEDIVQELFLNLWNNRNKIEIHTNVSVYLYKACKNLALNYIRNSKKYREAIEKIEQFESYSDDHIIELKEFRSALFECIDRLPERCKEILLMHRIKGFKQKEIAHKLNISIKTIKNQIWSSLQRLKICLETKGI